MYALVLASIGAPGEASLTRFSTQKNHNIRTVVNKLDSIASEFRVFEMEVLAGDDDLIAEAVSLPVFTTVRTAALIMCSLHRMTFSTKPAVNSHLTSPKSTGTRVYRTSMTDW